MNWSAKAGGDRRWVLLAIGTALLLALLLVVRAGGSAAAAPAAAPQTSALQLTSASFPDYMDPQLAYTAEGWTAMYDVYIPLLTYRHASGDAGGEVIPGLARSMPRISDGGRTYTLFLRQGLHYSDGQPVRASDFEFAVERMFKLNSGGYPFYADIVGAERFLWTKRGGISGIVTDNRSGKIVIHLERPLATFTNLLALMFVAPVPPSTPDYDASSDPPPATGPYAFVESVPGAGWSYVRNPEWARNGSLMPQIPDGNVDGIDVTVVRNPVKEVREVEAGESDVMLSPPPASRAGDLERRFGGTRLRGYLSPSTYYFWMNTTKPPFDDVRVRQAVNYAVDARALSRIYARQLVPAHQILPPGIPGYRKLDLYRHNMRKARRLLARAAPRDREITVWGDNESPNAEAVEYYAGVLRSLGFKVHMRIVGADNYFTVIGNTSTPNLDTGWSDWFEDFPHPDDFFRPLLSGNAILPRYNGNFAQIDVPSLNRRIDRLARLPGRIPTARYAALDRSFMKLAPWVPYGTRRILNFVSKAIDYRKLIFNPSFGLDLTSLQLR